MTRLLITIVQSALLLLALVGLPAIIHAQTPGDLIFSLTDQDGNFRIFNPRSGALVQECTTGSENVSKGWEILQWNNNQSLCIPPSASNTPDCPLANLVRKTDTAQVCYWKGAKKIKLSLNSNAMKLNGCAVTTEPGVAQNPGGYSLYLSWSADHEGVLFSPDYPSLSDLTNIYVSAKQTNNSFTSSACPASLPPDSLVGKNPYGFTYLSVIATEIDPITLGGYHTIFYQVLNYDNRYNESASSTPQYLNCNLSAGDSTAIVVTENSGYYTQPFARPGQATQTYSFDVLPRMKRFIEQCRPASAIHWDRYRITSMYVGMELANTVAMTDTFENPTLRLVQKATITPTQTPTSTPTPTTSPTPILISGDIDHNGKVDIFDYNLMVAEFGRTGTFVSDINGDGKVDIFDYNTLVTNFGKP